MTGEPPHTGPPAHAPPAGQDGNPAAIVSLVLGIVAIVTGPFTLGVLGILLGIVAIVLGVVGRRKVGQGRTREHGGIALAGLITGVVGLAIGVAVLVFTIFVVGALFTSPEFEDLQREIERQQELQQPE